MNEFKVTGGAQIGRAHASWPFASLTVSGNKLQINASIIGKLVFAPGDIVSITPDSSRLSIGKGIRINHRVEKYSENVVFTSFESASAVISRIEQTGFLSNTFPLNLLEREEISAAQSSGVFPIKVPAAIAIIVMWNLCLLPGIVDIYAKVI